MCMFNLKGIFIKPLILCLALFCFTGLALAEGRCPDGYFPIGGGDGGWEGCAPMGGDNDAGNNKPPQWQDSWGAIAVTNGAFGYSYDFSSEQAAIQEALSQCQKNASGKTCTLEQSYYNQCIALAWGNRGSNTVSAPDIAQAEQLAIKNCEGRTKNCKIYYSGCSLAKLVP